MMLDRGTSMAHALMWHRETTGQDDGIGAAWSIDACSEIVYTSGGPPVGDQASDQPLIGWIRCNDLFLGT
jgi:hypothetical protein